MKILYVVFPDPFFGGIARCIAGIHNGIKKEGLAEQAFLFVGNSKKTIQAYDQFGDGISYHLVGREFKAALDITNQYDVVVHVATMLTSDILDVRKGKISPYYDSVITKIKTPTVAFLHDPHCFGKYSPYIDVWEKHCRAFISVKPALANIYGEARGAVDVYSTYIPVNADMVYNKAYFSKKYVIASTARIYNEKRQKYVVAAMFGLPEWELYLHAQDVSYWALRELTELASSDNIHLNTGYTTAFTGQILDDIYREAALVYNTTRFPAMAGGVESVTMEGAIRGAVPLTTIEWTDMYPNGFPRDACYVFEMGAKIDSNITQVIESIDIKSPEYKAKQTRAIQFIKDHRSDRAVGRQVVKILTKVLK